jgi:hypothetical protein
MSQLDDPVTGKSEEQASVAAPAAPYGVAAEFESPEALLDAIRAVRALGYAKLDAYTPFPVHGIDEALGAKRSQLGWLVLACGLLGVAAALLMQWWTGTVGYPLVIGGKPFFALQFSVPITFELGVLFAAFGAVLGMLLTNGLPRFYHPIFQHSRFEHATGDAFLLAIEASSGAFNADEALEALRAAGALHAEVLPA